MDPVPARHIHSSAKVLDIPKLVSHITTFLCHSDIVRLAQVCRRIFEILVPMFWKHMEGAKKLLRLITSTKLLYDESGKKLQEIALGNLFDPDQFNRFNLYAPLVQSLEVFHLYTDHYNVSGWPILISQAQGRPLLPNLRVLSIASMSRLARASDILMWIKAFGTHRIVNLSMWIPDCNWPEEDWSMTHSLASETLDYLVAHCPNIQTLMMCPHRLSDDPLDPQPGLHHPLPSPKPWYDHLQALHALCDLSVTNGWVSYPLLVTLGKLPFLETLKLYVGSFEGFDQSHVLSYLFSRDSFHALRQLFLRNVGSSSINDILSLRELLGNITELEIDHSVDQNFGFFEQRGDWVNHGLLPSLVNVPHLEILRVTESVGEPNMDQDENHEITAPQALNAMSRIPLRMLNFERLNLGYAPFEVAPKIIWPNVTELILPCQGGSLKELEHFAALPHLTRLKVCLSLKDTYIPKRLPVTNAPLSKLEASPVPEIARHFGTMEHNVRELLKLWPNLREIEYDDWSPLADDTTLSLVKAFNRILTVHRAIKMHEDNSEFEWASAMRASCAALRQELETTIGLVGDDEWETSSDDSTE